MDLKVTAKLPDGMIGEYVYLIGEEMAYFKEKIQEPCDKAAQAEEEIRRKNRENRKDSFKRSVYRRSGFGSKAMKRFVK